MSKYEYTQSLNTTHFRLLTIHPGGLHNSLECSLETLPLDSETKVDHIYEAISYSWGSKENMRSIICDGMPFPVTWDLEVALMHLRYETAPRRLWIDQICINQEDLEERSAQVKAMNIIYMCAGRVLVWLGEESQTSNLGLQYAAELCGGLLDFHSRNPGASVSGNDIGHRLKGTELLLPEEGALQWTALRQLYSRRWFRRLWIVQEVLLNSEVMIRCGNLQCEFRIMEILSNELRNEQYLRSLIDQEPKASQGLVLMMKLYHVKNNYIEPSIEFFVSTFAAQELSDPRDHVYGLLSIVNESETEGIVPDYRKSVAEVFIDFTKAVLSKPGYKSILNMVEFNRKPTFHIPSWVPDWTIHPLTGLDSPCRMVDSGFSASRDCSESFQFSDDDKIFYVRGRHVDSIIELGASPAEFNQSVLNSRGTLAAFDKEMLRFLEESKKIAASCTSLLAGDDSADVALSLNFSRELFLSLIEPEPVHRAVKAINNYHGILQSMNRRCEDDTEVESIDSRGDGPHEEVSSWAELSYGQIASIFNMYHGLQIQSVRITRTSRGNLASIHHHCQVGDIVVIFYGWKTPFVLRPVSDGYLLIGECYVHGLMHGEAIENDLGVEMEFPIV